MIKLLDINKDNWREACFITDDPERKCPLDERWTTSAAFSIVQASYDPAWEIKLISKNDELVGLVFYGIWDKKNAPLFCRYIIDIDHQGKGIGQEAIPLIVDHISKRYSSNKIYLTLEKENERAVHIYTKFGFKATGQVDEGEDIYVYEIGESL